MAKAYASQAIQTSFLSELDNLLDEQRGKSVRLPISPDDVGGALLALLSNGLYTNPLDCIREYVQNSVDAKAHNVVIKITGNSVIIHDDGHGMDLEGLLRARQFGLSPKSLAEHVGFRGIGIYSGFDLCKRLRITSTKADDENLHVLTFDFAAMKLQLEKDQNRAPDLPKTSLIDLLSEHTRVTREASGYGADSHLTIVELQDISDVHIRQLANRTELRSYLLENLPVDFSDEFEFRHVITEMLELHVPGYHAVRIMLQSDGLPDELVAKDGFPRSQTTPKEVVHDPTAGSKEEPGLQTPSFGYINTTAGQQVAYYWSCLNRQRGRLQPKFTGEEISVEGFVYKVKGFTIGDRQKLRSMFKRKPQLYPWYTGEIYVIDPKVIPNAERDDFETNQPKRALELAVSDKLADLEKEAETFQARGVADERIPNYRDEIQKISDQIMGNTQADELELYSRMATILIDIKRQKSKASQDKQQVAEEVIKQAENLQKQLRRQIDKPQKVSTKRKQAAKNEELPIRQAVPSIEPAPSVQARTLLGVLKDAGWEVDEEVTRLVDLIQESLETVLSSSSPSYRNLLADIEAKLNNNDIDE